MKTITVSSKNVCCPSFSSTLASSQYLLLALFFPGFGALSIMACPLSLWCCNPELLTLNTLGKHNQDATQPWECWIRQNSAKSLTRFTRELSVQTKSQPQFMSKLYTYILGINKLIKDWELSLCCLIWWSKEWLKTPQYSIAAMQQLLPSVRWLNQLKSYFRSLTTSFWSPEPIWR